jgi:hypothetical protein
MNFSLPIFFLPQTLLTQLKKKKARIINKQIQKGIGRDAK